MITLKRLEYTWIVISIILLGVAVYFSIVEGFKSSLLFYIFPIIGMLRYLRRRKERLQLEKSVKERYRFTNNQSQR